MEYEPHTYFCHYTTRQAAFEHILPDRHLRMWPYDRVNDPLENQPWRFVGGSYRGESHPDDQQDFQAYLRFTAHAHEIWGSAKLLALTVDAPDGAGYRGRAGAFGRGWARARMWDQYAERHAGVCLLFDRSKLEAAITEGLSSQGLASPYHRAIEYSDESSVRPLVDLMASPAEVSAAGVREFVETHKDELFFLKRTDWQTEFEYRFVVTAPDCAFVSIDYGDALRALIVGNAFPTWQRAGAIELCERRGADARRINWSWSRPVLLSLTAARNQDLNAG